MSDPFDGKMITDIDDNLATDDDEPDQSTTETPVSKKRRTREGDSSGDQSLRTAQEVTYPPDLPPEVASNALLSLFSTPALKKVREVGEDIYLNWKLPEEDPVFSARIDELFQKYDMTTVDLTEHFQHGQLPRSEDRDYSSLGLNLGKNDEYVSEKSVADTLSVFYNEKIGASDNTRTGFFGAKGVIESSTQNFTNIMDIDIASLISHAVIAYLKENQQAVTEIQAMVLPDRIFVSANEPGAVTRLIGKKLSDVLDVTRTYQKTAKGAVKKEKATGNPIPVVDDERQERTEVIKQLARVLGGSNPSPELEKYLTTVLVSALVSPEQTDFIVSMFQSLQPAQVFVDATGAGSNLAPYITGPGYANRLILVGSGDNCHAEQNLMVGLVHANYTGDLMIAGAKRPCQTCQCAFALVAECKNPNLVWYGRPGGAWSGSTKKSFAALANELKISLTDVKKVAAKLLIDDGQFATAFNPEADDVTMESGFGDAVTKKRKKGQEIAYADRIPRPLGLPDDAYKEVEEFSPGSQESQYSESSQDSQNILEGEVLGLKEDLEVDLDELQRQVAQLKEQLPSSQEEGEKVGLPEEDIVMTDSENNT